jgi:protocatechuate 3,4-dioxygenase beta subunit
MKPLAAYRRAAPGTQPLYLHPPYASSILRAPTQPLVPLPHTISELSGPVFRGSTMKAGRLDLTRQHGRQALGQRIVISGKVMDENNRPVAHTLIELWQANAAGRYLHAIDQHNAPLDPNFIGGGLVLTDAEGRYSFMTIRPGEYPWRNHYNAWRPAHIHFSLFGPAFATRLVTQMYFPGDPLLARDPIFNGVLDEAARNRLISIFDWDSTIPDQALGYRFDIVLRGQEATPLET